MSILNFIRAELNALQSAGLTRQFQTIGAIKGSRVRIGGKWYISFCSNDYLGLAQHPAVCRAAQQAIESTGWGSGASRLMAGTFRAHQQLEHAIARFKHAEDALLFTSGYAANLGVITTLVRRNDVVFCDELNHASLVDAARLTKADLHIYRHRNTAHLESLLQRIRNKPSRRFIITDAIFSMDGDAAPLPEIVRLARRYHAVTIIDEAHSTGVLGKNGRGLAEQLGLEKAVDISIGTLSKALGSIGGFVTGHKDFISYLRSKSRPFIFTTALPPAACAAGIAALKIIRQQPPLRRRLWTNTHYVKDRLHALGFDFRGSETPIIPIMIGDAKKSRAVAQYLWQRGLFTPAIRPPTVPVGQSRLRITITALHTRPQLDALLDGLNTVMRRTR